MLYGRAIQSSSIQSSPLTHYPSELTTYSNQVTTVINRFWNKWRYEYLVNFRETNKHYSTNKNQPFIQVNNVVLVHSDKTPRPMWRMGVVTELIKGKMDNNIRGALVRLSKNSLLKRPVNKLYPIEYVRSNRQEPADTGNLTRSRQVTTKICRMNIGRNIGPQYLVESVRTAAREPLYYVIDIFYFLSNTCKYF